MSTVAIIPARAGSKRIPGKNVRSFLGEPILSRVVHHALAAGVFSEVMVSTDADEIAEVARTAGAHVPFLRSSVNATDHASTLDVLLEVFGSYEAQGKSFERFCCLYPTSVLVTPHTLKAASDLFVEKDADFMIAVTRYSHPPERALIIEQGVLTLKEPQHYAKRTQDFVASFHDAGQFYFGKVSELKKHRSFWSERTLPWELGPFEAQDIDQESDWQLAELKFKNRL